MKTIFVTVLSFVAFFSGSLLAAEPPTITISKSDTVAIAVSPITGADGAAITKIVQNDLAISGYFSVTGGGGAALVVSGTSGGAGLQGKVTDHAGKVALSSVYNGSMRARAHEFANDIIETLTGNKGIANTKIAFVATKTGTQGNLHRRCRRLGRPATHRRRQRSASARRSAPTAARSSIPATRAATRTFIEIDLGSGARNRIIKFPGTNSGAAYSPDGGELALQHEQGRQSRALRHRRGRRRRAPAHAHAGRRELADVVARRRRNHLLERRPRRAAALSHLLRRRQRAPDRTGHGYSTEPNWSPDGKKVAFNIAQGGGFSGRASSISAAARRARSPPASGPAWGADSRHLIYAERRRADFARHADRPEDNSSSRLGKISEPTWSR